MNDLIRPALYDAWHDILPVTIRSDIASEHYDVVGAICETSDFLGKERELAIKENDLLAIKTTGAYGFTMSSNYNSRGRAAEIMVDGDEYFVVREREPIDLLFANESLLP
jgi:diaminopimelate decarboxylase